MIRISSVNYIVKQDITRQYRLEKLIEYCFLYGQKFGNVFIADDQNAACIIVNSELKKIGWRTIIWDLKLIVDVIGYKNVRKALERERLLKNMHPKYPFIHLWFIGVDPTHQQKGIGSQLLQEVVAFCATTPVYLETSVVSNLAWYQRFGFEVIETIDLGYTLYVLEKCS